MKRTTIQHKRLSLSRKMTLEVRSSPMRFFLQHFFPTQNAPRTGTTTIVYSRTCKVSCERDKRPIATNTRFRGARIDMVKCRLCGTTTSTRKDTKQVSGEQERVRWAAKRVESSRRVARRLIVLELLTQKFCASRRGIMWFG